MAVALDCAVVVVVVFVAPYATWLSLRWCRCCSPRWRSLLLLEPLALALRSDAGEFECDAAADCASSLARMAEGVRARGLDWGGLSVAPLAEEAGEA